MTGYTAKLPDNVISRRTVLQAGGVTLAAGGLAARTRISDTRSVDAKALTTRQLAGQRVIYSYPGLTVPSSLLSQIRAGLCGGVIFFGGNISSLGQISSVIRQLEKARLASPVTEPLLLMTDQEGGEVRRLPGQPVLSEKQIGESRNPEDEATAAGQGAGKLLAGVGMNVNLAPVLDVYRKAGDFDDQFQRSYSMNPHVCAELGQAFITAQQKVRVAATGKHFPGLGAAAASENTDLRPVTLNVSLRDLRAIDEVPFQSAISAGVRLVMASWAVYPALDARLPSGLSARIIGGELRGRLGFRGVTITDALEAGALRAFGTTARRALMAAQAGMDVLLASSQNPGQGEDAVNSLASALQSGKLPRAPFLAAVNRVISLRKSLG